MKIIYDYKPLFRGKAGSIPLDTGYIFILCIVNVGH